MRTVEVLVDAPTPLLARSFTYGVPRSLADDVHPGVRVRVRLSGRRTDGFVIGAGDPSFSGPVRNLESVVSAVPVLRPDVLRLCEEVADHYAGTVPDVVRLAVPPRVAAAERGWAPAAEPPTIESGAGATGWLARHPFVAAATTGPPVRGAWSVPAGADWAAELAAAASRVAAAGRAVIIVVPDARDLHAVSEATAVALPRQAVATLSADAGPAQRYGEFLRVLSGEALVVVGTRAAAFAPVAQLGLLVVWNDGDPSLAEQRAPYPHAREVLALRSHAFGCALLLAGHARSVETQRWVEAGWLGELTDRSAIRAARPRAFATPDRARSPFDAGRRLPTAVLQTIRDGAAAGPVLVQVARRGYVPVTACQDCREIAVCPRCAGPLAIAPDRGVGCRRCGASGPFRCPHCEGETLRAVRVGAGRTAEELGRAFPGVPVRVSTAEHPVADVGAEPLIVVTTPGVEPAAAGGYRAGALLDAQEDLWRVGLRAREDALRRWLSAAALLRPAAPLAVNADPEDSAVQALVRWDPAGFAGGELERRRELHLPPADQVVQMEGEEADIAALIEVVSADRAVTVLGPLPLPDRDDGEVRALLRAEDFRALLGDLRAAVLHRLAARQGRPVRVQVDPDQLE